MQFQALTVDALWWDITAHAAVGSVVPTLRGRQTALVVSVDPEMIAIKLDNGAIRRIKKDCYASVLAKLREQGRVRQANVPNNEVWYVLGVLKLLPYFKAVEEYDPSEGKQKHFIRFVG